MIQILQLFYFSYKSKGPKTDAIWTVHAWCVQEPGALSAAPPGSRKAEIPPFLLWLSPPTRHSFLSFPSPPLRHPQPPRKLPLSLSLLGANPEPSRRRGRGEEGPRPHGSPWPTRTGGTPPPPTPRATTTTTSCPSPPPPPPGCPPRRLLLLRSPPPGSRSSGPAPPTSPVRLASPRLATPHSLSSLAAARLGSEAGAGVHCL